MKLPIKNKNGVTVAAFRIKRYKPTNRVLTTEERLANSVGGSWGRSCGDSNKSKGIGFEMTQILYNG